MNREIILLKRDFFAQGGAEKYARNLADAFHQKGCQVTILTTNTPVKDTPYEIHHLPLTSTTSFGKIWEFESFCQKYIKNHETDIIFGMDRNSSRQTHIRAGSGVHLGFLERRKQIEPRFKSWRHLVNPLHRSILKMEKQSFEHPALKTLFTNSHMVKNEVLTHYDVDPNKISVIHNGVEWKDLQQHFDTWPTKKRAGRFEFLFLGNNFERKGLRRLLLGLKNLSRRDFHLSIVGKDKNQAAYEELVQTYHLEDNITFYGPQKQVHLFFQKADCLIIPSLYDPFANVTVEALAMGLFVVSSKTNGGSEVLTPETGCTIENLFDNDAITRALEIALNHPKTPESAKKIRDSVQHLDFSLMLNKYVEKTLCTS